MSDLPDDFAPAIQEIFKTIQDASSRLRCLWWLQDKRKALGDIQATEHALMYLEHALGALRAIPDSLAFQQAANPESGYGQKTDRSESSR